MKCINCGKEINSNAKFCKYCGTQVKRLTEVDKANEIMWTCSTCGGMNSADDSFCTNCGTSKNKIKRKKKRVPIFIIFFLFIIVVASVVIIRWYFSDDNKEMKKEKYVLTQNEQEISSNPDVNKTDNKEKHESKGDADKKGTMEDSDSVIVEESVGQIREKYNSIVSGIESEMFEKIILDRGITAYYEDKALKAIIVTKETNMHEYNESYYYDDKNVIFAYYESDDAHRFYFQNNELIRWRYCADATDSQNAVNHDLEKSSDYDNWESSVEKNAEMLKDQWESYLANGNEYQGYILEGSDTRYISVSDLETLTKEELKIARNEIYARHGRKFEDETLRTYFSQFDWYNPVIEPNDFEESMLNDYEIANRDLIVQYEKQQEKAENNSWKQAYIEYLKTESDVENQAGYTLITMTANKIPQIVEVGNGEATGCRVIYYAKGKVQMAQLNRLYFTYIPEKNLLCNSEGNMDCYYDIVYSIIEGEMTRIAEGNYGAEDNSNVQYDDEGNPVYIYEWNGENVSAKEYEKGLEHVYDKSKAVEYDYNNLYSVDEMIEVIESYEE